MAAIEYGGFIEENKMLVIAPDNQVETALFEIPNENQQVFDEVTAKVPMFILKNISITEQLPFLLKLAENLTVSILMGMEGESSESQNFSYQGSLQSLIEIQRRIYEYAGIQKSSKSVQIMPEMKSIETNTEVVTYEEVAVTCMLLDDPTFTRSGRQVKKRESLSYLYEEEDTVILNASIRTKVNDEEGKQNEKQSGTARKKRGRKRKLVTDDSERTDHPGDKMDQINVKKEGNVQSIFDENSKSIYNNDPGVINTNDGVVNIPTLEKELNEYNYDKTIENKTKDDNVVPVEQNEIDPSIVSDKLDDEDNSSVLELKSEVTPIFGITSAGSTGDNTDDVEVDRKQKQKDLTTDLGQTTAVDIEQLKNALKKTKNTTERKRLQKLIYELRTPWRYKCVLCSFRSKRESHFRNHMHLHKTKNPKIYSCEKCDFKTIRAAKMTVHLDEHSVNVRKKVRSLETQRLSCKICDSVIFGNRNSITDHMKAEHGIGSDSALQCSFCDYMTDKPMRMKRHMTIHESPANPKEYTGTFTCAYDNCKYTTTKKTLLKCHHKDHHMYTQRSLCDICGASFKRKHGLKMHKKFMHTDRKLLHLPFLCPTCSKRFRSLAHLKEHQVTHTNKRAFLCETCGIGFKTKSAVKRHSITVHSDSKKYTCQTCDKKFTTHTSLMRHFKSSDGKCGGQKVITEAIKAPTHGVVIEGTETENIGNITTEQNISDLFNTNQLLLQSGQAFNIQILQPLTQVQQQQQPNEAAADVVVSSVVEGNIMEIKTDQIIDVKDESQHSHLDKSGNQVIVLDSDFKVSTELTGESVVMGAVPVVMDTVAQPTQLVNSEGEIIWTV